MSLLLKIDQYLTEIWPPQCWVHDFNQNLLQLLSFLLIYVILLEYFINIFLSDQITYFSLILSIYSLHPLKLSPTFHHHQAGPLLHCEDSFSDQLWNLHELGLDLSLEGEDGCWWRGVNLLLQVTPKKKISWVHVWGRWCPAVPPD